VNSPLAGRRIGFTTSVIGHGGSEVLIADAIEAAVEAGALVTVWCAEEAAIRTILAKRDCGRKVPFRDWPPARRLNSQPPQSQPATTGDATSEVVTNGRTPTSLKTMMKSLLPMWYLRERGFHRDARRFAEELRTHPVELLVVNVNGSEAVSLAGPMWNVNVINIYHLSYTEPLGGWLTRHADHRARKATLEAGRTIHTSFGVRNQWLDRYDADADTVTVIYNGVDINGYCDHRDTLRCEYDMQADYQYFIVPARLDPIKGHSVLFTAIGQLSPAMKLQFWLCGEGSLHQQLQNEVAKLNIQSRVSFLGQRSDLPRLLAAADAVVLPSVASENLSVAVLEACAAGIPAVVTQVGGMDEAVQDGVSGFVVPPNDAAALAKAITALTSDPDRARQMGAAAKAMWQKHFQRDRMKAEYVAAFAEALS
jgi:glycosyltransferase involved in cell wall biosynthesis